MSSSIQRFVLGAFFLLTMTAVPHVMGQSSNVDHSSEDLVETVFLGTDPTEKLKRCEGDCDCDEDCVGSLVCFQRESNHGVPGCYSERVDGSRTDYCVRKKDLEEMLLSNPNMPVPAPMHCQTVFEPAAVKKAEPKKDTPKTSSVAPPQKPPRIISSSSAHGKRGAVILPRPKGIRIGDLLVLFLSRTDDPLPLKWSGWKTAASCFKQDNGQPRCLTTSMCVRRNGRYCKTFRFKNGRRNYNGHDLATVVMTKVVTKDDLDRKKYSFKLKNKNPAWAIIAAVRHANGANPIRSQSGVSCDKTRQSVFKSTFGRKDDLLLMHMAFDDTSSMERFQPPKGSHFVAFTRGSDEAGFLYSERLRSTGKTGDRVTRGRGGPNCKDENIAIVIRQRN